jgi:hypothetical protein
MQSPIPTLDRAEYVGMSLVVVPWRCLNLEGWRTLIIDFLAYRPTRRVRTARDGSWSANQVQRILARAA